MRGYPLTTHKCTCTHTREAHTQPPQEILFVNISHVERDFKCLLCWGEEGIMTALTRELARLRFDATNNLSVAWKANESRHKSWFSVREDAAWSCGEAETSWITINLKKRKKERKERNLCLCVMNSVCCKLGFTKDKMFWSVSSSSWYRETFCYPN